MAGTKRTKGSFDNDDYYDNGSSSKRVRFKNQPNQQQRGHGRGRDETSSPPEDFEFDHEEELEQKKKRRGAINDEELSDEEEVGGGVYSDDSDEESDQEDKNKKKTTKDDDDDDFDMFADTEPQEQSQSKNKKAKGKRRLELNEIEGQELDSRNVDSEGEEGSKEPKLTAFNMQQEMEEGSFDKQGNYTVNKADPEAIHDRWMEGVSRKDIAKAKDAQIRREQAEALKEAERQANVPQTKDDIYRELLKYLKPGENVNQAIGKLSGSGGISSMAKLPKWKQKLMEKKNRNKKPTKQAAVTEEEEIERQRKVERLTELADQMMALGHFNVYQDTFEEMVVHLRREGVVPANWMPETNE
ncbi:hypothetical protein BDC45DRAFT_557632 [Circinella umbellata]|nr:hypothetical protein BDC45DRAFT_557632 [Circinella umbellata]